ncbi:MAG: TolC family protein [Bacteroidales bacterium]|nr:TolC family protein [Bacteroidales bacterium]MCF8404135.1 TolC family protein [Bacteroidales bacterium]
MKNKIILLSGILLMLSSAASAQESIEKVLRAIENNNTELSALRNRVEAEKLGNKTGIYPENPVAELGYLYGSPAAIGNKTNVIFKQSFDFPTAYRYKNQISDIKNVQAEIQYQAQLKSLMLETSLICNELIYSNSLLNEFSRRQKHATDIANSYKMKYEQGEANVIEYNKAQLNLLNIRAELESLEIKKSALLADLTRLNGGISIEFEESSFKLTEIPADFEQWYLTAENNNPQLIWLKQELELSKQQVKLNTSMGLPKIQVGYMSEKVTNEQFRGATLGLSIPLWENKNAVKYAKAHALAIESMEVDNKLQIYNQLLSLHQKATGLQKNVDDYRSSLLLFDNSELLLKALDAGEISLIEYILELSLYYESFDTLLELERDLNKTVIELNRFM